MNLVKGAAWVVADTGWGYAATYMLPDVLPDGRPKIVGRGYFGRVVIEPEDIIEVAHFDAITDEGKS